MQHIIQPKEVKVEYIPLQLFVPEETEYYAKKEQREVAKSEVYSAVNKYIYRYG